MNSYSARDRLLALAAVTVGVFIFVYSVPRFFAYSSLATIPGGVTEAMRIGADLPADLLAFSFDIYSQAAGAVPQDAVVQQDLGRLEMRRAYAEGLSPAERRALLISASDRFRAAIMAAPSRSFPWSLEAVVQAELSASPEQVSDLLRMSYILGPHEASSMLLRARVAGRVWPNLSGEVQGFIRNDYSELWRYSELRSSLAAIYIDSSNAARIALREAALQRRKDALLFDKMVLGLIGPTGRK